MALSKTQATWQRRIQTLLTKNDRAVHRAILVIYSMQTEYEQQVSQIITSNGVGFNSVDVVYLTSKAQEIIRGHYLTPNDLAVCRNKMKKYWHQLMLVATGVIPVDINTMYKEARAIRK